MRPRTHTALACILALALTGAYALEVGHNPHSAVSNEVWAAVQREDFLEAFRALWKHVQKNSIDSVARKG